ncbi:MAG: glycosyltransferase family 4 protein [Anaerolineae bacterium]|nr:glycosyltransferase family 4 protein [Anaerolineae bacterium]
MIDVNRQKIRELAGFDDIDLLLLVPKKWPQYLGQITLNPEHSQLFEMQGLPTMFQGRESAYLYTPSIIASIHRHKPDIIHVEQGPYALSYSQAILSKKIFAPQAKCVFFTWWNLPYNLKLHWQIIEKFNLANSDYAITGNQDAKLILQQRGFDKPITVLPQLGVDTELYRRQDVTTLKAKLGLDAFTIGYVGRFVRQKGILTLIQAVSNIKKPCHILLVGRGELKSEVQSLATELGISDRLHFVDTVPHDQIPLYLNCMDVMVLPSLTTPTWMEQFGHVLIEAMACEVPVIGSDSAEIPHVIGDAGLIFREGDVQDLVEKLCRVMADEQLRHEMVCRGRQRVLEKYTHKMIAKATYDIYQELL